MDEEDPLSQGVPMAEPREAIEDWEKEMRMYEARIENDLNEEPSGDVFREAGGPPPVPRNTFEKCKMEIMRFMTTHESREWRLARLRWMWTALTL